MNSTALEVQEWLEHRGAIPASSCAPVGRHASHLVAGGAAGSGSSTNTTSFSNIWRLPSCISCPVLLTQPPQVMLYLYLPKVYKIIGIHWNLNFMPFCKLRHSLNTNVYMDLNYMLIIGFFNEIRLYSNVLRKLITQIYLWGTFVRTPCTQHLWFYHEITSQIRHNEIFLTTQKQFSPWSFWKLSVWWKHHKIRCILIPSLRPRDFLTSEARSFKSVFSNKIGDNTAALLRKKRMCCAWKQLSC